MRKFLAESFFFHESCLSRLPRIHAIIDRSILSTHSGISTKIYLQKKCNLASNQDWRNVKLRRWPSLVFSAPTVLRVIFWRYVRMVALAVARRDVGWVVTGVARVVTSVAHRWRVVATAEKRKFKKSLKFCEFWAFSPFLHRKFSISFAVVRAAAVTFVSFSLVIAGISGSWRIVLNR